MVKHIVLFRLEGDQTKVAEAAAEFKKALENLPALLPELKCVEVGLNDGPANGNWTLGLTACCDNYADLEAYSAAPAHIACVAIIKPFLAGRACIDYTV